MTTALYRMYDAEGVLLYVGISMNAPSRIKQHRRDKHWWDDVARITITQYDDPAEAARAELEAILAEHPIDNIAGRPVGPLSGAVLRTIAEQDPEVHAILSEIDRVAEQQPHLTVDEVWGPPTDICERFYRFFRYGLPDDPAPWEAICAALGLPPRWTDWPEEASKDGRSEAVFEIAAVLARFHNLPNPLRTAEGTSVVAALLRDHIALRFPSTRAGGAV